MASPDVAAYTGLELLDVDAQELLDTALVNLAASWPEWTPREGNTEVVLLEEQALIAEAMVYRINQLPAGIAEVLLRLLGLERALGTPVTTVVEFTVADTLGHTIPAGTLVRLTLAGDVEALDLATDVDLVIPAAAITGTVAATGTVVGPAGNGAAAGTLLELLDAIPFVNTVTLDTPTAGGTDPEDGVAFLDRAVSRSRRLTSTLVRPEDVEAFVAEQGIALRVKALDLYDPTSGDAPGDNPGYVTVALATAGGGAVSAPVKAALEAQLVDAMHGGLIISVVDADVTAVPVDVTVLRRPGFTDAEVADNVVAVLEAYLNPDAWDWSRTVRVNELIAQADTAVGVDTVLEVTTPADDLALTGVAPLAAAGVITVTVEAP